MKKSLIITNYLTLIQLLFPKFAFLNFGHKLNHEKTQLQRRTVYFTTRSF
jgi:hypothetical protein